MTDLQYLNKMLDLLGEYIKINDEGNDGLYMHIRQMRQAVRSAQEKYEPGMKEDPEDGAMSRIGSTEGEEEESTHDLPW